MECIRDGVSLVAGGDTRTPMVTGSGGVDICYLVMIVVIIGIVTAGIPFWPGFAIALLAAAILQGA